MNSQKNVFSNALVAAPTTIRMLEKSELQSVVAQLKLTVAQVEIAYELLQLAALDDSNEQVSMPCYTCIYTYMYLRAHICIHYIRSCTTDIPLIVRNDMSAAVCLCYGMVCSHTSSDDSASSCECFVTICFALSNALSSLQIFMLTCEMLCMYFRLSRSFD
jgi:hypothetical protein